jgi:uroporphyrinogen decarboxylase
MRYEKVDCLPVFALEPTERYTVMNWRAQGLPEGMRPEEYLGMGGEYKLPVFFQPYPQFETKILSEDETYRVEIDPMGATVKRRKDFPYMYYGYIDYPIKDMADWHEYKKRFVVGDYRYGDDPDGMAEDAAESDNPVSLMLYPFFMRLGLYGLGLDRFLTAFYEEPELIHEMFDYWSTFTVELLEPVLQKVTPDVVTLMEDLAFKTGPHISPSIYKEFWLPYQNRIVSLLSKYGVENICLHSAGDFRVLIPMLLDNGVSMIWPLDRNSSMDPVELRKKFGKGLRMAGGVSKSALLAGKASIDEELERLMPLIREGGFFPALDDIVPPETPFDNYVYFIERCKAIKL